MQPHPWFNPLYRRVLTACVCVIWLAVEAYSDPGSIWSLLAMGVTAWAVWDFFLAGHYPVEQK